MTDFFVGEPDITDIYFEEIADSTGLSVQREQELSRRIKQGDVEARNELVEFNLRYVVKVSKEYQHFGLSMAELISEGNMGLITAAERFDADKGCKFISYAVWWIRQAIIQALADNVRVVRLPMNQFQFLHKVRRSFDRLAHKLGREVAIADVSQDVDVSSKAVEEILIDGNAVSSLDAVYEDESDNLGDNLLGSLNDTTQWSPDVWVLQDILRTKLRNALSVLSEKELFVLIRYFGLDGMEPLTIGDIAVLLDCTRQYVDIVKGDAVRRLRHPKRMKELRELYEGFQYVSANEPRLPIEGYTPKNKRVNNNRQKNGKRGDRHEIEIFRNQCRTVKDLVDELSKRLGRLPQPSEIANESNGLVSEEEANRIQLLLSPQLGIS